MKLILIISLLITSIFASNVKYYKSLHRTIYVGTNKDIPQIEQMPRTDKSFQFFVKSYSTRIIDNENKKAWFFVVVDKAPRSPSYFQKHSCRNYITKKDINNIDLNMLRFVLKAHDEGIIYKEKGNKDLIIWVKIDNNKKLLPDGKSFRAYSLIKNKYVSSEYASITCISSRSYPHAVKNYQSHLKKAESYTQEKNIQEKRDIKKRKTIQIAENTDQGMILQIKGPLVLVQTKTCTMRREFGACMEYGKTTEWVKRKELTFKNQK